MPLGGKKGTERAGGGGESPGADVLCDLRQTALSWLPFKNPSSSRGPQSRAQDYLKAMNLGVLGSGSQKGVGDFISLPVPAPLPGRSAQLWVPSLLNEDSTIALRNGSWAATGGWALWWMGDYA